LGDWGISTPSDATRIAPELESNGKKLVDDKSMLVVSFLWWHIATPANSTFQIIASTLRKSVTYGTNSQFANGKYIYVIGDRITGEESKGKPIVFWPVYIVPITSAPPNSTFKVGTSPVLSMEQFKQLQEPKEIPVSNLTHLKKEAVALTLTGEGAVSELLENLDAHYIELRNKYLQTTKSIDEKISILNDQNATQTQVIENEKNKLNAFNKVLDDLEGTKSNVISDSKTIFKLEKITGVSNISHAFLRITEQNDGVHALFIYQTGDYIEVKSFDYRGQQNERKKMLKILKKIQKSGLKPNSISRSEISEYTNASVGLSAMELLSKNNKEIDLLKKELLENDPEKIVLLKEADKTKLLAMKQYYEVDFPALKSDYKSRLAKAIEIDKKNQKDYDAKLVKYEKIAGENTKMPTQSEARNYFNQFKIALKDPYSAILEDYRIWTAKRTNEEYPCIKLVALGVRAKNSWGAYNKTDYWVAVKDGKLIDYGDTDDWGYMGDGLLTIALHASNISCEGIGAVKPVQPTSEADKISAPIMKEFSFSYSE
jgi:hypothetical protein